MPAFRRSIRAFAVTAVAAAAILPGSAAAETPSGPFPACAPGVLPTREHPCMLPPCAAGVLPTREQPCILPPCAAGVYPKPGAPCALPAGAKPLPGPEKPVEPKQPEQKQPEQKQPEQKQAEPGTDCRPNCPVMPAVGGHGDAGTAGDKAGEQGPPALMGGFLSRVWRFDADVDGYDAASNTLNVTVSKILNLPKRFKTQDDAIVDQDADVIFTKTTKVFGADGKRIRTETGYDAVLDAADSVAVTGKITPRAKWNKDEDGSPVTTIRAKRVTIAG
jgi:hypothetical protein